MTGSLLVSVAAPGKGTPRSSELTLGRNSLWLALGNSDAEEKAFFGTNLRSEGLSRSVVDGNLFSQFHTVVPFGRSTLWTSSDKHVFVGTNESFEIEVYDHAGRLERLIRVPHFTKTLTPQTVEEYEAFRAGESNPPPANLRQLEGVVRLPPGTVVHDFQEDLMLVQPPHDLDVPIVHVYRLERRRPRNGRVE